jgi:hypothetical protein
MDDYEKLAVILKDKNAELSDHEERVRQGRMGSNRFWEQLHDALRQGTSAINTALKVPHAVMDASGSSGAHELTFRTIDSFVDVRLNQQPDSPARIEWRTRTEKPVKNSTDWKRLTLLARAGGADSIVYWGSKPADAGFVAWRLLTALVNERAAAVAKATELDDVSE